jgi:hypothetical protein
VKREITPHKGGRTHKINTRITPAARKQAEEIKAATGRTIADILEDAIKAEYEKTEPPAGHLVRIWTEAKQ